MDSPLAPAQLATLAKAAARWHAAREQQALAERQVQQTLWVTQGYAAALLEQVGEDPAQWAWDYNAETGEVVLTALAPNVRMAAIEP